MGVIAKQPGLGAVRVGEYPAKWLHHVLQVFQRGYFDDLASWFRLERGLFARERVDTFASFGGWLLVDADLHQARYAETARSSWLEVILDECVQGVENRDDLLATQFGSVANGGQDF